MLEELLNQTGGAQWWTGGGPTGRGKYAPRTTLPPEPTTPASTEPVQSEPAAQQEQPWSQPPTSAPTQQPTQMDVIRKQKQGYIQMLQRNLLSAQGQLQRAQLQYQGTGRDSDRSAILDAQYQIQRIQGQIAKAQMELSGY